MSTGTAVNTESASYEQNQTYRKIDGLHPLRRIPLDGNATINTAWRTSRETMRTIHNDLDILHKVVHEFQGPWGDHLSLLSRQLVHLLQHRFYIILSEELLSKFH
jgi:hypothetical protein